jgi:hypothetical protein
MKLVMSRFSSGSKYKTGGRMVGTAESSVWSYGAHMRRDTEFYLSPSFARHGNLKSEPAKIS